MSTAVLEGIDRLCNPQWDVAPFSLEMRWRTRSLTLISLTVFATLLPFTPIFLLQERRLAAFIIAALAVIVAVSPIFFRWTGSLRAAGYMMVVAMMLGLAFLVHDNGGLLALAATGNSIIPLFAAYIVGSWQSAAICTGFIVVETIYFAVAYFLGFYVITETNLRDVLVLMVASYILQPIVVSVFGVLMARLREQMLSSLEADVVAKQQFFGNVAHELRTPVYGAMGIAELLAETPLTDAQLELLGSLLASQTSLLDIVNDILSLASVEDPSAAVLTLAPVDLYEAMERIAETLRFAAAKKGIRLAFFPPCLDAPSCILADELRLNQILLNLVGNAVKFTDAGSVTVSCAVVAGDIGHCRVSFTVSDTGIGIDRDFLSSTFREPARFAQTQEGSKRGGTGLGLFLVRRLLKQMGATLRMVSHVGEGTTASFVLEARIAETEGKHYPKYGSAVAVGSAGCETWSALKSVFTKTFLMEFVTASGDSLDTMQLEQNAVVLVKCSDDPVIFGKLQRLGLPHIRLCNALSSCSARSHSDVGCCVGHILDPPSVFLLLRILERKHLIATSIPPSFGSLCHPKAAASGSAVSFATLPKLVQDRSGRVQTRRVSVQMARVLIAEDNAVMMKIICHQLVTLGFRVENLAQARNGLEAVSLFSTSGNRFDVALLDCQMPELSGPVASTIIRLMESESPRQNRTFILLHSASAPDCVDVTAHGANGFLPKPFTTGTWKAALSPFCDF